VKKKVIVHACSGLDIGVAMYSEIKEADRTIYSIDPPEITTINQTLRWLKKKPSPTISHMTPATLGIGMAALCVRWGTWLAFLLDGNKPVLLDAEEPDTSTISESELLRVYTEASFNLEQLLKIWFENEPMFWDILAKAYQHLPMPCDSSGINPKAVEDGIRVVRASPFIEMFNPEGVMMFSEEVQKSSFRILSNMLIKVTVQESRIGEFAKGSNKSYSLKHRRLSPRQELMLFHDISARMAGILVHRPVWQITSWPGSAIAIRTDSRGYPKDWSITEASLPLAFDESLRNEW
jgi:hypothetical protein